MQIAVVVDDKCAPRSLGPAGHLRREQLVGFFARKTPFRDESGPADRLRSIDQHDRVERRWVGGLEQQGNVADHDAIAPSARRGLERKPPPVDLGMDDPVELGESRRIAHHSATQRIPAKRSVRTDVVGAEPGRDCL